MLSEKNKSELDKLIGIAVKYREGTLSRSQFLDWAFSLPEADRNIELFERYIMGKGVYLVRGDDDVEEIKEEAAD